MGGVWVPDGIEGGALGGLRLDGRLQAARGGVAAALGGTLVARASSRSRCPIGRGPHAAVRGEAGGAQAGAVAR